MDFNLGKKTFKAGIADKQSDVGNDSVFKDIVASIKSGRILPDAQDVAFGLSIEADLDGVWHIFFAERIAVAPARSSSDSTRDVVADCHPRRVLRLAFFMVLTGITTEYPVHKSLTTARADRHLPLVVVMTQLSVSPCPHLAGDTFRREDHEKVWKG